MQPGPRNLITDIDGLSVGQSQDATLQSGVSVVLCDAPYPAAVHVMGGAPGTRETDLLAPDKLVPGVDALVLSGGSAFGLAACDGVASGLRAQGRGFAVGPVRVPIVPGAIIFDLINGGDKSWDENPYPALGRAAFEAAGKDFALGSFGAGTGALTGDLKGGVGSASSVLASGARVGALVVVNALGRACGPEGHFLAAPFEHGDEFGGRGVGPWPAPSWEPQPAKSLGAATTIAVVATDVTLDKAQLQRMAVAAHDGMARALLPSHTPLDGDLVFALSTARRPLADPLADPFALGHAAATTLSRAIARAIFNARAASNDLQPDWHQRHTGAATL